LELIVSHIPNCSPTTNPLNSIISLPVSLRKSDNKRPSGRIYKGFVKSARHPGSLYYHNRRYMAGPELLLYKMIAEFGCPVIYL